MNESTANHSRGSGARTGWRGVWLAALLVGVMVPAAVEAESAPMQMNFQGRLTNSVGTPVTATTSVRFTLIQGGTAMEPATSGAVVYQEDQDITPDSTGVFVHVIGTGTPGGGQTLEEADFVTGVEPLFVEMSIASEPLLPRTQVLSVGYAIEASRLDGKSASEIIGQAGGSAFVNEVFRHGAGMQYLSASQIEVGAGVLGFSDAKVRKTTVAQTWDFANGTGPLGLDTGTENASSWYYLYAIPDPIDDDKFSAVASLNAPAHVGGSGPTGNAVSRYLGSFNNGSSSNIRRFYQDGNRYRYDRWVVYSLSNAKIPTAYTEVPLTAALPETVVMGRFQTRWLGNGDETLCMYTETQGLLTWIAKAWWGGGNSVTLGVVEYPVNRSDRRVFVKQCESNSSQYNGWLSIFVHGYNELLD